MNATAIPSGKPVHRRLTSARTTTIISVICVIAAILLDRAVEEHIKAMARDCGDLVRMPTWCQLGYFAAVALAIVTGVHAAPSAPYRVPCF
jgi:hypothetical protein